MISEGIIRLYAEPTPILHTLYKTI